MDSDYGCDRLTEKAIYSIIVDAHSSGGIVEKVSFSTATRYCVVELVGITAKRDDLPTKFTIKLLCVTGVSQAGFDQLTGKWLVNMQDGFPGGTDEVKRGIHTVLANYGLKADLTEIEEHWGANV